MDFGLIILIIIASVIGNIVKESKKQQESNTRSKTRGYERPKTSIKPSYKPSAGTVNKGYVKESGEPSLTPPFKSFMDTMEQVGKMFDEGFSLEGQRHDIGETYEFSEERPHPYEEIPGQKGYAGESTEPSISFKAETYNNVDDYSFENAVANENSIPLGIKFDSENIIRGIVLAEVLGPPKCKRR